MRSNYRFTLASLLYIVCPIFVAVSLASMVVDVIISIFPHISF